MNVILAGVTALVAIGMAVALCYILFAKPLQQKVAALDSAHSRTRRELQKLLEQRAEPDPDRMARPAPAIPAPAPAFPRPTRTPPQERPGPPVEEHPRDEANPARLRKGAPPTGHRLDFAAAERDPTGGERARTGAVKDRIQRYRDLLGSRARPRQLQDLIDEDPDHRAVHHDPAGGLRLTPFDPDDPSLLLVAITGTVDGNWMVLPTHNYRDGFRTAFHSPVQNPEVVHHLFDFDSDGSRNLQLFDPAVIRVDDSGAGHKVRAGRMGGYASGE